VNRGYVCIIVYILSYEYTYCEFRILMISNAYCFVNRGLSQIFLDIMDLL
jgi:hypothetical protein